MQYSKASSGNPLDIPAAAWNELLAMLAASKQNQAAPRVPRSGAPRNPSLVPIRNASATAIDWFRAVKLTPTVLPADGLTLADEIVYDAATPDSATAGAWGVTQQPLAAHSGPSVGGFGEAIVGGVTLARVNIADIADTHVESDASLILQSSTSGSGKLVWVAGGVGTASATGEQWAIIRIGGAGGGGSATLPTGQYVGQGLFVLATNAPLAIAFPFLHDTF